MRDYPGDIPRTVPRKPLKDGKLPEVPSDNDNNRLICDYCCRPNHSSKKCKYLVWDRQYFDDCRHGHDPYQRNRLNDDVERGDSARGMSILFSGSASTPDSTPRKAKMAREFPSHINPPGVNKVTVVDQSTSDEDEPPRIAGPRPDPSSQGPLAPTQPVFH